MIKDDCGVAMHVSGFGLLICLLVGGLAGCAGVTPEHNPGTDSATPASPEASATVRPGVTGDPRCPGEHIVLAYREKHWPDGGVTYYFHGDGPGVGEGSTSVKPADFDPFTATDKELRRYDFPARPKPRKSGASAKKQMKHWRHRVTKLAKLKDGNTTPDYICITDSTAH